MKLVALLNAVKYLLRPTLLGSVLELRPVAAQRLWPADSLRQQALWASPMEF